MSDADRSLRVNLQLAGFTLIEVLVTILILSVLAGVIVDAVVTATDSSSVAACRSDYKLLLTAQEAYRSQVGSSATSFADLESPALGVDGQTVGPWLKEAPSNGTHYLISFDSTPGRTFGDIEVASVSPAHAAQDGDANCAYA